MEIISIRLFIFLLFLIFLIFDNTGVGDGTNILQAVGDESSHGGS